MLRGFFLVFALVCVIAVAFLGFRGQKTTGTPIEIFPDMVRQMKVRAQAPLAFFADGRGIRPPVTGTIPIGYEMPKAEVKANTPENPTHIPPQLAFSAGTDYVNTGRMGANWGTGIPLPVDEKLMARGRERFTINCTACHGPMGDGNGVVKQLGLATVQSLQQDRIRTMSDGEIFNTITNGKNTMMAYGPNVTVNDRWAIIAYLRALQRSQNAGANDVPPDHRADLDKPPPAPSPAPAASEAPKKT
jgi:mono/diheme cytochrome c family protein